MRWLVVCLCVACGSSTATRSRLLEDEELEALRQAQPQLVAEAESAEADARRARESGEEETAGDLETTARLLFDLAMARQQAERFEAEGGELAAEVESEATVLAAAIAEREDLVAARVSRRTREAALEESRRAFAIAEGDEGRRLRRRSTEVNRARLDAAAALADRTELLGIAARALGGEVPAEVAGSLRELRAMQGGAEAIARARMLHGQAMARLGAARATRPVSRQRCQSLVNMAVERDFNIAFVPEGLAFRDVSVSRGAALGELLTSFPDGPILLQGDDSPRLKRALARHLPDERLAEAPGDTSRVLLPACVSLQTPLQARD